MLELQKRFNEEKTQKDKSLVILIVVSALFCFIPFVIWAIWLRKKNDDLKIEQVYPEYIVLKNNQKKTFFTVFIFYRRPIIKQ